ncbi:hypothetical protein Purlil1_745 [Purpureocillium lilacinum]|uniref:Uncharacterized protein n=1 Tax=Purpureocillium lilacinum TaxID=33203 RepID=A0ABR0CFW0_PURLI|nr:hypothetical protein Purlil1_745 [Purpureocillium lilacinum]
MIQMQGPVAAAGQLDGLRLPPAAAQGTVRSWHAVLRNRTKRRASSTHVLRPPLRLELAAQSPALRQSSGTGATGGGLTGSPDCMGAAWLPSDLLEKPCPATRPLIGGPALDRWTTGGGPDCRLLSTPFAPRLWSSAPANACGRFRLPLGLPIRLCLAWPDKTAHDSPPPPVRPQSCLSTLPPPVVNPRPVNNPSISTTPLTAKSINDASPRARYN